MLKKIGKTGNEAKVIDIQASVSEIKFYYPGRSKGTTKQTYHPFSRECSQKVLLLHKLSQIGWAPLIENY